MPVDLTPAGLARPYPPRPRLLPWAGVWVACNVFGAAAALLLWPKGVLAQGARFWLCVFGIPNLVFLFLLGIRQTVFAGLRALRIRRGTMLHLWRQKIMYQIGRAHV